MSSLKAIAAVTYILQQIVKESVTNEGIDTLGVEVFTKPLDRLEEDLNLDANALNLYLYMVTENGSWKNQDLISRNQAGQRVSNPYLALDLYYMLSTHGSESYYSELMLGYAMVAFHDNAIIGRQFIANELAGESMLANSGLSEQIEQIRISPLAPNTEEVSGLWTMFGAKHRLSSYYKVSVALLRREREIPEPLPVQKSKIYVQPINIPAIHDLIAVERTDVNYPNQKIFFANDNLFIKGLNLKGDVTRVVFDAEETVTVSPDLNTEIVLSLPTGLSAGIHSVQIIHELMLGEPEVPHKGFNSNLAALVISPLIQNINFTDPQITLTILPEIEEDTKYTVLLNEVDFDTTVRPANEYAFKGITSANTNSVSIDSGDVEAGTYLIRIRINNATSPLFHDFSGPNVTIP